MRLHTLTLRAVGPFADEQVVDFDRLGAGGLFLFEGPTGVGKSTILDAITFALYGGLASATSDPSRIRSDFVEPHVRPEVTLELSVRGRRHRITRTPAYERPKQRGTGTTKEAASVHLQRWEGGAWSSVSHSHAEVGTLIGELIGLSQEQFRKVVLLPQGEFAAFLVADEKDRGAILTTLFGTEIYAQVARELGARASAVRVLVREANAAVQARCAAAWEAAGVERDQEEAAPSHAAQVALLEALAAPIEHEWHEAVAAVEAAQKAESVAAAASRAAAQRLGSVRRLGGLLTRRSAFEAGRQAQEARGARIAAARRALPVGPLLDALDERARQVAAATAQAIDLGLSDPEHLQGRGHEALAERAVAAREVVARLDPLAQVELGLAGSVEQVATLERAALSAGEELDAVVAALEKLPEELAAAQALAEQVRAVAARRELLEVRARVSADVLARLGEVEALTSAVTTAHSAHRHAVKAFQALDDEVRLLEDHRLANLSGVLAERLVSGDPCMVCGSAEHPSPAAGGADQITEEHLRARMAARDDARILSDQAQLALVTSQATLAATRDGLGGLTAEQARADGAEIAQALADAVAAEERSEGLQAAAGQVAVRGAELSERRVALTSTASALAEQLAAARANLERDLGALEQARGDHPSVADRLAHLSAQAEADRAAARAVSVLGAAMLEHTRLAVSVETEAAQAGFEDEASLRSAVLSQPRLAALEQESGEWQSGLEEVRTLLASPELSEVAGVGEAEAVEADRAAEAAHDAAVEAARDAQGTAATREQRVVRFAARLAEVQAELAARDAQAAEADEVIALDELARGQAGSPRMPLVNYVLRYWFEQVVEAANVRLGVMSSGKYQLLRTDTGSRKDSKVGLGLAVLDRHTGRERSPSSLSGGERFYVSLSLALGLADVVVAQAGGADLDTLFIDEGFGTLDADTLESVMGVIDELRGNGRVIGIVSHVPDLKERVSERLSVRRISVDGPSRITVFA